MRFLTLFILSFCLVGITQAQSVKIKKGVVTVDGAFYCNIKTKGAIVKDMKLYNQGGDMLVHAKPTIINTAGEEGDFIYYTLNFIGHDQTSQIQVMSLKPIKKIIGNLYEYQVINGDAINSATLQEFVKAFPPTVSDKLEKQAAAINGATNVTINNDITTTGTGDNVLYNPIERDRDALIFTMSGKVKQDRIVVATYKSKSATNDGKLRNIIRFFHPTSGVLLAVAENDDLMSEEYIIKTTRDDRTFSHKLSEHVDHEGQLAEYLIGIGYL